MKKIFYTMILAAALVCASSCGNRAPKAEATDAVEVCDSCAVADSAAVEVAADTVVVAE